MSYYARVQEAVTQARAAGMLPKGLYITLVRHDDDCPMHPDRAYGTCACDPAIEILSLAEYLARLQRGEQ